jgi:hypothetical protein
LGTSDDLIYVGSYGGSSEFFDGIIDEIVFFNDSLTASEIQDLYKAGLSQHANTNITLETRTASSYNTSDSNLLGVWGLNDNMLDATGDLNGTCTNCPTYDNSYGVAGQGANFDGSNDVIEVPDPGTSQEFSISVWVYSTDTTPSYRGVFGHSASVGGNAVQMFTGSNEKMYIVYKYSGSQTQAMDSETLTPNTWVHYVGTRNDSSNKLTLYRNGVEVGTTTNSLTVPNPGGNAQIGNDDGWSANLNPWQGYIDELRIYNRPLSNPKPIRTRKLSY